MMQRATFEGWQILITVIAFAFCFTAFVYFCVRALRMREERRRHAAHLPLQAD